MKRSLLFLLVVTVSLSGCGKGRFEGSGATKGGGTTFTYALNNKIVTLDPGKVQDVDMTDVLINVFEGLVAYSQQNVIEPRIAEKWEFADGGKTIIFTLRPNVKFHNGRTVTAEDFKWSWERNLGAALASPVATTYLGDIVGVKEFVDGKAKSIPGIEVRGPLTLAVKLDKPRPYFIGNLTYPCAFVMAKEAVKSTEIQTKEEAVGTGPFKFERIAQDQQIDLVANPDYFLGAPKIAKISRPIIKDASTRLTQYKNGGLDYLTLSRQDVKAIEADPKMKADLIFELRPAVYYFGLNQNTYPPFKDPRVRKAFAMSFNRPYLVKEVLTGFVEAKGLIAAGVPGYREDYPGLPYDVDQAKRLLAEAGYPGGKGLPPVQLSYREATPDSRAACEAAATAWKENLGITVQPQAYEWGALLAKRNKGELQLTFLSWYADYLDPQNFLSLLMTSTTSQNHEGYSNKVFDRLCAEADVDQDPAHRLKLYQQAEDIVVNEAGRIPIYFQRDPILISKRVKGVRSNLFGLMPHLSVQVN